jgi:hypothetical protein
MTTVVLDSQHHAISIAWYATTAKILALELLAGQAGGDSRGRVTALRDCSPATDPAGAGTLRREC